MQKKTLLLLGTDCDMSSLPWLVPIWLKNQSSSGVNHLNLPPSHQRSLKILTILNRKVSLRPGKIKEGKNEIKSTKAWNEKINFILPVIPL